MTFPLRWFRRATPAAPSKRHKFGEFIIPEGAVVEFAENFKEMYGGKHEHPGIETAEQYGDDINGSNEEGAVE